MDMMDAQILSTPDTPVMSAEDAEHASVVSSAREDRLSLPDLMNCAQKWTQLGRPEAVLQLYQTWYDHTTSPHRHIALFNWGTLLSSLGRSQEAIKIYETALTLKSDFIQARVNLGHQQEATGQAEAALASWREALALLDAQNPTDESLRQHTLNNLARALETIKRYDESEAYMVRSLELDPAQPKVI